jgi:hypothetical protein
VKGHPISYSPEQLAWLEANRLMVISDYASAFAARFGRAVSAHALHALRKRRGWKTGRTGCFPKGNEPFNKGKPHPTRGRAAETQFKKGRLPHNTKWLGHERVSKDGYVEISIAKTNPHTGYNRRYVLKHRYVWEQANGPLPKGTALKCLDGNKQNCDPSNWEAVPRALLPRLAGGNRYRRVLAFDDAAPELRPTILAVAKLEHAARNAIADTHPKGGDSTQIEAPFMSGGGAGTAIAQTPSPHPISRTT